MSVDFTGPTLKTPLLLLDTGLTFPYGVSTLLAKILKVVLDPDEYFFAIN